MTEAVAQSIARGAPSAPAAEEMPVPERRWGRMALMLVVPLALFVGGLFYWQSLQGKVTTHNAYVKQDRVSIGSQVSGKIVEIAAREGDEVEDGQLLFRVDPEPYRIQLAQANAAVAAAQAAQLEARARLTRGPAVPGEDPQIAVAKAQREAAELNLRRTEVRAPISGRIAAADRLQVGQEVMQNLPVLTLVNTARSYVEANFKETDLADMRIGQPAELRFDAYPDMVLRGHVASIGAGTGSEFSILPAQNATGNWVKVTQRIPVRIAIDDNPSRPLIAGLSTEVSVFTDEER